MRKIVVGVDGSPNSQEALVWAMRDARVRGCEVDAVMCWHEPTDVAALGMVGGIDPSDIESGYRAELDEIVEKAHTRMPDVPLKGVLVRGTPGLALLEAADSAELLVVGRRGHGPLVRFLLGSISQRVVREATCPVVVVPPPTH